MTDYGAAGLLGVLVPQANTTVEPELWALLLPDWSMLAARLTSGAGSIAERLVDYTDRIDATAAQFANAPVTALAFACTGASYLAGAAEEDAVVARVSAAHGVPLVTAARASTAALRAMGAQRVALLSPYPEDLTRAGGQSFESVLHLGQKRFACLGQLQAARQTAEERLAEFELQQFDLLGHGGLAQGRLTQVAG